MASSGVAGKYSVHRLPAMSPPFPSSGGRVINASGEMAQIISNESIRHVAYLDFKVGGKPRGNHYHIAMKMHGIYVIKGKLRVTLVDIDDQSRDTVVLRGGDFIRIKPHCAHVFAAQEYTQALELNDTPFNPDDTIPYAILEHEGDNTA